MVSQYPFRQDAFDADGFLQDIALWDDNLARAIAQHYGIAFLTTEHFKILHHMRFHYLHHGSLPNMKHLCRECRLDEHDYRTLFGHHGGDVWRIAGLPNPGAEVRAYID